MRYDIYVRLRDAMDEFVESEHPRDDDGKFTDKNGGSSSGKSDVKLLQESGKSVQIQQGEKTFWLNKNRIGPDVAKQLGVKLSESDIQNYNARKQRGLAVGLEPAGETPAVKRASVSEFLAHVREYEKERERKASELHVKINPKAEIVSPESAPVNYKGFRKGIKEFMKYKKVNEWVANAHKQEKLTFKKIPLYDLDIRNKIYKSPSWHGQQSSEYYVGIYNNKPVYARKSNHWGDFYTNLTVNNATTEQQINFLREQNELNDIPEEHLTNPELLTASEIDKIYNRFYKYGDQFGRVGANWFNWELEGGARRKDGDYTNTSQLGIIEIPQELFE